MSFSLIPRGVYSAVTQISPKALAEKGVRLVLADLDNTLVPYRVTEPSRAVRQWRDALAAGIDGVLIVLALRFSKWLSLNAFMETMLSSVLLAAGAVVMSRLIDINVDTVIIGAIMPIVPGAAFTIAIRDTLQGDYVAGSAKVLESLIKVAAIVVGAGLGMIMTGGFHL